MNSLLALEGTERVRLLGRRDVDGRNASLILTLPRGRYDAALVERVRGLFRRRFGTSKVETHHVLDESDRSRVHFLVHAPGELPELALRALEAEVIALSRTWDDELRDLLIERRRARSTGRRLAEAWLHRFPGHYKGYTSVDSAAHDIACFGRLAAGEGHVVSLQPLGEQTRVCLYKEGGKVELSEAMPMLEDLGLRVIEELSTRLTGDEDEVWVQEFRVLGPDGAPLDVDVARGRRRRGDRRRLARRRRERPAQPARRHGGPRPPPARRPARLPQVPPAGRLALHRGLPERRAGGQLRADGQARALLRGPLRPVARARRGGRERRCATRSSPTSRRSSRSTTTASCATSCS